MFLQNLISTMLCTWRLFKYCKKNFFDRVAKVEAVTEKSKWKVCRQFENCENWNHRSIFRANCLHWNWDAKMKTFMLLRKSTPPLLSNAINIERQKFSVCFPIFFVVFFHLSGLANSIIKAFNFSLNSLQQVFLFNIRPRRIFTQFSFLCVLFSKLELILMFLRAICSCFHSFLSAHRRAREPASWWILIGNSRKYLKYDLSWSKKNTFWHQIFFLIKFPHNYDTTFINFIIVISWQWHHHT